MNLEVLEATTILSAVRALQSWLNPFNETHFGVEGQVVSVMRRHLSEPSEPRRNRNIFQSAFPASLDMIAHCSSSHDDALNWQVHNQPPQSSPVIAVGRADVWADNYERTLIKESRYRTKPSRSYPGRIATMIL